MKEQSRIITEEQWKEYRQLLCLRRQWERERQELEKQIEEQLQEANEVIQHYAEKNGYHKAMDYLNKWGVK